MPPATPAPADLAELMIAMRDGVRLATDVFLPEGAGPFPALLERTPYDKAAPRSNEFTRAHPEMFGREELARLFTAAGFAVVFQDCRGRYGSEGQFTKYRGEAEDGYDTIGWIAAQPWCDGRVGTFGMSYSAHTQMAAAALHPPALAAMLLDCGGFSNAYHGGIRYGGALELKQATWAFRHARRSREAADDPVARAALDAVDMRDWFARMPWKRGHSPLAAVPAYEDYFFEQWEHGRFDTYWQGPALNPAAHYADMPAVPSMHISGWYDPYARTAVENFTGLTGLGYPAALILGPWTHGSRSRTFAGDVDFGPDATFDGSIAEDFVRFRIAFFRRALGLPGAAAPEPAVRVFVMGGGSGRRNDDGRLDHGGRWLSAESWPPETARASALHLHPGGRLDFAPAPVRGRASWRADPDRPVPSIGGPITSGAPVMQGGAFDQVEHAGLFGARPPYLPLASRADVLVFETEPLDAAVTICGDVTLHAHLASDRPTTDLTAKLVDVYPPNADYPGGYAMNLADGILRTVYRKGFDRVVPLVPGEPTAVRVDLFPTANRFEVGHRIRIEIAASNFPRFDVNPQAEAGDDLSQVRHVAINTLLLGPDHPSRLELFVLEA